MALSGHALLTRNPAHNQLQPHNKRDIHGVARTACSNCTECPQVGGSILDWDEFVLIEKGKLMKFLRLQFISIPGHVLCAYCGCPPARHGKGLLRQTKTQGDKWKWTKLKIRQSSPSFRDDIATRGEKARETEGLFPGCHYRQSVLSSFNANQHEDALSLQHLH